MDFGNKRKTYTGTYPPFGFVGKDGNPQGFEIDMINALAREEGFKVELKVTAWQGIMSALNSKTADILLESMTITDERKKEDSGIVMYYIKSNPRVKLEIAKDIQFSKEYYGMAVRKGDMETLKKINSGLKKIKENGKYEEIYQKWFKE